MLGWLRKGGDDGSLEGIVSNTPGSVRKVYNYLSLDGTVMPQGPEHVRSPTMARSPPSAGAGVGGTSCIAIYDATNSTKDRRAMIELRCRQQGIKVMFIESMCDDHDIIMNNIREVKLSSPDYIDMTEEEAINDFQDRIHQYQKHYTTLDITDRKSVV